MDVNNWKSESVKKFYSENRSDLSQLYKSERYFLEKIELKNSSVLDIGCACGGFYNIFKQLAGVVVYTGIDVSSTLIEEAKRSYPDAAFYVAGGEKIGFGDNAFDLVYSSGVFHLIEDSWKGLYREAYRVSRNKILIDFRLTDKESTRGKIFLDFYGSGEKNYAVYTILNVFELFDFLNSLDPLPARISAYGYMHKPSHMSSVEPDEVCMAFFLVEKGGGGNTKTEYNIELPFKDIENKIRERYL